MSKPEYDCEGHERPRECTAFYSRGHMTGASAGANARPCIEDEEAVRMIEYSAYAALEKENAELRAGVAAFSVLNDKLQEDLTVARAELRRLAVRLLEKINDHSDAILDALELRAELKQTDERAQCWIAEAARLKAALVEISALAGQDEHELSAGPDVAREALGRAP
jgi:hypothetical protein